MLHNETELVETFGSYLRFLRRRARLTQTELSIAVGYSPGQISMLENGQRSPDPTTVAALFVTALGIDHDLPSQTRLINLARNAAQPTSYSTAAQPLTFEREELELLESLPPLPEYAVERTKPLNQLRQWLASQRTAAICGLAGMGKSTLAAQLAYEHARNAPICWITLNDPSSTMPETLLRQIALFTQAHITNKDRLGAFVRRLHSAVPPVPHAQQFALVASTLNELATPLLVFDDAHLLNDVPPTLELLQRLLQHASSLRMLFVARRDIELPGIPVLHLRGLEKHEATHVYQRMLGTAPESIEQLWRQTEGNPMLLRLAISYWEQQSNSALAMNPLPTAHYLVEAVLRTLEPSARRLLDLLAVWRGVLDLTQPQLADLLEDSWQGYSHHVALNHLQSGRIVEHLQHAQPHPLLREPLVLELNTQPIVRRQTQQVAAAWALQTNQPLVAAQHLVQIGELHQACDLVCAQEIDSYRLGQGAETVQVAEELLDSLKQQHRVAGESEWKARIYQLLVLRGDLLVNTTRVVEAHASYRAALELTTDTIERARLAEKLATSCQRQGNLEAALELCQQARDMLGLHVDEAGIQLRLQIDATRMRVLINLARFDEARQICDRALLAVRPLALFVPKLADTVRAYAYLARGYIARFQGDNQAARGALLKSVTYAEQAQATSAKSDALTYLSITLRDLGDFAGAEQVGQQALELADQVGNEYLISNILHHLSLTDYYHGDLERALARVQRVLKLKQPMGDTEGIVASRLVESLVLTAQGQPQAAYTTAIKTAAECELLENSWLRGLAAYGVGAVLSLTGDLAEAERQIQFALQTDALRLDRPFYAGAEMYLGLVYVGQGRLVEAQQIIECDLSPEVGYSTLLLRELVRSMWLLAAGEKTAARQCAEQLQQQAERYGFRIYAIEAERLANLIDHPPPLAELPGRVCCPQ
jgi:ATP/maltotriose-dependent transcriptional regulator MalT/DNA-binding XRE family transcriptional regulator